MYLHLHENIEDSHNMFGGYFGRRRLKSTLVILLALSILFLLFHQRESKI